MIRQGDTFYIRVAELPEGAVAQARIGGRIIIAEGEVTGHAHAIRDTGAVQYKDPALNMQWIVVTDEPVTVEHEEHGHVKLGPGTWWVPTQVEYERGEVRRVVD